jgi:hypothetical protein
MRIADQYMDVAMQPSVKVAVETGIDASRRICGLLQ